MLFSAGLGFWGAPHLANAARLEFSTLSPFPIDTTEVVLVSRHVLVATPVDPESLITVTSVDTLLNPTREAVRIDLGLVAFPPLEADSSFSEAATSLRWNGREMKLALAVAPPRDWRGRFGKAFTRLPQARLVVAPGAGVLAVRSKIRWSQATAYGRLEQMSLSVNLSGADAWAGKLSAIDVRIAPRPLERWLDYLESFRAHGRAIQTRPPALTVDERGVVWHFENWEPSAKPFAPDNRLLLLLEPNEAAR